MKKKTAEKPAASKAAKKTTKGKTGKTADKKPKKAKVKPYNKLNGMIKPYAKMLEELKLMKNHKKYNCESGEAHDFVKNRIVPLLQSIKAYRNKPAISMFNMLRGDHNKPEALESMKASVTNMWRVRPSDKKRVKKGAASKGGVIDKNKSAALTFLKSAKKGGFKTTSFNEARTHLKSLGIQVPKRTKELILKAIAKEVEFNFPKSFFGG